MGLALRDANRYTYADYSAWTDDGIAPQTAAGASVDFGLIAAALT